MFVWLSNGDVSFGVLCVAAQVGARTTPTGESNLWKQKSKAKTKTKMIRNKKKERKQIARSRKRILNKSKLTMTIRLLAHSTWQIWFKWWHHWLSSSFYGTIFICFVLNQAIPTLSSSSSSLKTFRLLNFSFLICLFAFQIEGFCKIWWLRQSKSSLVPSLLPSHGLQLRHQHFFCRKPTMESARRRWKSLQWYAII